MARTGVFIALLDPDDAFKDTVGKVATEFGFITIAGNKLKLYYEIEEKHTHAQEQQRKVLAIVNAFVSTLAWVTKVGVGYQPFDYVECIGGVFRTAPVMLRRASPGTVESGAVSRAGELWQLVVSDWRLQLALADYRTALRHEGHELIFLYRCIEWLKWRFGGWDELRKELCITRKQLDSVKQEANTRYMARHATKDVPDVVPPKVRDAAFANTELIIQRYMDWLRSQATNQP